MANHHLWNDEYWLLLIQLYLREPVGVKPLYSRALVDVSMELHIPPQVLYEQMFRLRSIDTPRMQRLWNTYAHYPKRLSRGVKLLRQRLGYGSNGWDMAARGHSTRGWNCRKPSNATSSPSRRCKVRPTPSSHR